LRYGEHREREGKITIKGGWLKTITDYILGERFLTKESLDIIDINKDDKIDASDIIAFIESGGR
jgi:hypothetical protein